MNETVTVRESALLGERYTRIRHKSGLDIYVYPKDLTSTYAMFATKYGSIDNCFKKAGDAEFTAVPDGIAHFLEHKMFESETGEDAFARYAKTGANANAFTSFSQTAYVFSCTDKVYESLEILLDFVTHPYFTPETVQKEQGIIAQEIRMGDDNPGRALIFGMLQSLYRYNPIRIEIAGTVESISQITSDVLYRCYRTFYNLHNMVLVVCGQVTPDGVLEVADRILKEQEPFDIVRKMPDEPREVYKKDFRRKMSVSKPQFAIGIKNPDLIADPVKRLKYSLGMEIADNILYGSSGEFFHSLYTDGLINGGLGYWTECTEAANYTCVDGESGDPDEVFRRFAAYVASCRIGEEDFERNKRILYARYVKDFDSTEDIASLLLDSVLDGFELFDYLDILNSIDLAYVQGLVDTVYRPECYSLTVIEPIDGQK